MKPSATGPSLVLGITNGQYYSGESLLPGHPQSPFYCVFSQPVPVPPLSVLSSEKQVPKTGLDTQEMYWGNACEGCWVGGRSGQGEPLDCNAGSDNCGNRGREGV